MTKTIRASFDGKVFVPLDPVDVQAGDEVRLEVSTPGNEPRPGSYEARQLLIHELAQLPPLDAQTTAEFRRHLEEAEQPAPDMTGCFDHLIPEIEAELAADAKRSPPASGGGKVDP